jgi:hypothetical protein
LFACSFGVENEKIIKGYFDWFTCSFGVENEKIIKGYLDVNALNIDAYYFTRGNQLF